MKPLLGAIAIFLISCGGRPLFERTSDGTPEAELRLANIEWRVYRDFDAARARLTRLGTFEAQLELARFEPAALANAERLAKTKGEQRAVMRVRARLLVEQGNARAAIPLLRALIEGEGPRLRITRLLARAGVMLRDRAVMMEGIDGYYRVSPFSGPPHLIADAYAALRTAPDDAALARVLAGIRFFDEAAILAPQSDVARYAAMLQRMQNVADEHYRRIALGNDSERALRKGIAAELKTMWPKLSFDDAVAEMGRQYGGYVLLGKTGGFHDTHIGHKVVDRVLPVEQYGRRATVRFIVLDAMVSNGFQSWRSDDKSGDGGWGTAEEIYQVRPMYADGPLRDWMRVTDPETRAKYGKDVAERLHLQYLDRVFAETKTRDAFLALVERDTFQYSILLHEGRHAIDGDDYDAWELEYRAKLSQVALADAPRAAVAAIVGDVVDDSPHGRANAKIRQQIDVQRLETMTDDQIRAAFRALDPLFVLASRRHDRRTAQENSAQ
ncbi:MAG TPA: hypothetical protein VHK90_08455 [Thermoanaerobaculia bacterium]|nr:hypothetical protein [Thermoanaerobaculia bacterium]